MKQLKKTLALLLSLLLILSFAACTAKQETTEPDDTPAAEPAPETEDKANEEETEEAPAEEKVTLTITSWFTAENQGQIYMDAWQEAADKLGYDIVLDAIDSESFKTKSKVQMASGEMTDICTMWEANAYLYPYIESGNALAFDDYMAASDLEFSASQLVPYYADGKNYILPVTTGNAYYVFYNKEMVEQLDLPLPVTMDDIAEIIEKCDAAGVDAFGLPLKDRWMGDFLYMTLLSREDPDAWNKVQNGEISYNSEAFLNAAKTAQQLVEMGAFPDDALNLDAATIREMFFSGRFPFFIDGGYRWSSFLDKMGDNLGYVAFPNTGSDDSYTKVTMSNKGFGLIVNAHSEHQDEAVALCMEYCRIVGEYLAENGRLNVIVTDTQPSAEVNAEYQKMLDDNALVEKVVPAWSDDLSAAGKEASYDLSQALFGMLITPEEYCEQYAQMLEAE